MTQRCPEVDGKRHPLIITEQFGRLVTLLTNIYKQSKHRSLQQRMQHIKLSGRRSDWNWLKSPICVQEFVELEKKNYWQFHDCYEEVWFYWVKTATSSWCFNCWTKSVIVFFFVNLSHFKCCIVLYFGWFVLMFDLMDWSFVTRDADKLIAYTYLLSGSSGWLGESVSWSTTAKRMC